MKRLNIPAVLAAALLALAAWHIRRMLTLARTVDGICL